ncbi:hypothetical protein OE88DRAFT_1644556 [Heliocybe sulcata]|uniref:Uncharacterized protein n=1 Tax=Heliocybe sulcata TaxID=5364 RepID=A0A5C3N632_9AGAM|nr:hypothetical protein OE88DRAFT_1644556 [Heliocybe sulcata]
MAISCNPAIGFHLRQDLSDSTSLPGLSKRTDSISTLSVHPPEWAVWYPSVNSAALVWRCRKAVSRLSHATGGRWETVIIVRQDCGGDPRYGAELADKSCSAVVSGGRPALSSETPELQGRVVKANACLPSSSLSSQKCKSTITVHYYQSGIGHARSRQLLGIGAVAGLCVTLRKSERSVPGTVEGMIVSCLEERRMGPPVRTCNQVETRHCFVIFEKKPKGQGDPEYRHCTVEMISACSDFIPDFHLSKGVWKYGTSAIESFTMVRRRSVGGDWLQEGTGLPQRRQRYRKAAPVGGSASLRTPLIAIATHWYSSINSVGQQVHDGKHTKPALKAAVRRRQDGTLSSN